MSDEGEGSLYPEIEPYEHGMLDVGDGNAVYWELCGNPDGAPAVVLHGGPGAGTHPILRRFFDPGAYRIVLFDQRGSGRSTPHAADPATDLSANTTPHLLADIERLRDHLSVDRWLVFGESWGAALALLSAETHPERVAALVVSGVTTGRRREIDWMCRGGVAPLLPGEWERFLAAVPEDDRAGDPVAAYHRLLNDPDPEVRQRAADEWCRWELSYIADEPEEDPFIGRFADPRFRLGFARLVTHYFLHDAWLEEGQLLRDAHRLAGIPGVMIHGRRDIASPLISAWEMKGAWPTAELRIVAAGGHGGGAMDAEVIRAIDGFARVGRGRRG